MAARSSGLPLDYMTNRPADSSIRVDRPRPTTHSLGPEPFESHSGGNGYLRDAPIYPLASQQWELTKGFGRLHSSWDRKVTEHTWHDCRKEMAEGTHLLHGHLSSPKRMKSVDLIFISLFAAFLVMALTFTSRSFG